MAVLISDRFHSDPRVLCAGDRAIGSWIRMLSWLSQWPGEAVIPAAARKMFGASNRVVDDLLRSQLLAESTGGWMPLGENDLWRISRTDSRAKIPAHVRARVLERDEYRCRFCSATDDLTLDHILPWSLGGPDTEDNLRVLCRPCNSARGNRIEVGIDG